MSRTNLRDIMWAEALEMMERAERLQRQFFQPGVAARRPAWKPPVDVFETPSALWVVVALPGVPADRIEAHVESGVLVVRGHRPAPAPLRRARVHRLEIPQGDFERRVELPPGPYGAAASEVRDGCLIVQLRKTP